MARPQPRPQSPHKPKPGEIKRLKQWEALERPKQREFPLPDPPAWKPLG